MDQEIWFKNPTERKEKMNFMDRYPECMDWVKLRLKLHKEASLYEVCVCMVDEIKRLDEQNLNPSLKGEIENERPAKRKPGRPRKSSRS